MNKMSRREAITGIIGTGATVLSFAGNTLASPEQESVPMAFRGTHQIVPLPFDPAKLNGLSEKIIKSHWGNNYIGSVKALNMVEQRLANLMKEKALPAYLYGELKREELIRTGSVVLHEKYFANLGGNGKADGAALKMIKQWFGSHQTWETEFKKIGRALGGGSGWVIMAFNLHTKQLHNYWAADHAHNAPFSTPLLVLDMYEHSYHMDYGTAAAKYVDAFMQNVNWETVNKRVARAIKMSS